MSVLNEEAVNAIEEISVALFDEFTQGTEWCETISKCLGEDVTEALEELGMDDSDVWMEQIRNKFLFNTLIEAIDSTLTKGYTDITNDLKTRLENKRK